MKAIYLEAINTPFVLINKEKPQPGTGEVLVKIKAAALNHRDVWIQYGKYFTKDYPAILGSDGAGIVTALGKDVNASWLGQEVIIDPSSGWGPDQRAHSNAYKVLGMPEDGTFAEYVKVKVTNLHHKPDHLTFEEAAALPLAGVTAFRAMFSRCGLKRGERVLITGAGGGVALFALQFAVAVGADVWVTSGSDEKIERAKELGALGGVNYKKEDWGKELKALAGGFDVIIDGAAGEGFVQLVKLANSAGRIGIYGGTTGRIGHLNPAEIFWKHLVIYGSTMGTNENFSDMIRFVKENNVKPVIAKVFPLAETEQAMRYMEAGKQFGKIVVRIEE